MILFGVGLGLLLLAGAAGCGLWRHPATADRIFRWGAVAGCVLALVPALFVLTAAPAGWAGQALAMPASPDFPFGIDLLSAWFLLIVLGVGATIAAYGVPYLRPERGHRNVGMAHLLVAVMIVALSGVVTARNVIAFLASWEIMALSGYFLVIFESEKPDVWGAGMVYLVLTHVCLLVLIGMFAACAGGQTGWRFEDLGRASAAGLIPTSLVLTLALVAFGIKAGAFPFHFWLPGAHAVAPSHVSALLSGIMLKVSIYGLLRMLSLLGPPPAWWGWSVLLMGLASSILGVLWALAQHDLKRLLAYHSVENIGIILLGVGLGALGWSYHRPALAWLGMTGALLHCLNHALFKSLLFLGAGAVVRETGTREIDRMGGLARRLPQTAVAFLIGCVAIVGLPPLNGFVSEWVIFRGLLGAGFGSGDLRNAAVVAVGLALTGALALACFTKLYGVVFLGTARNKSAETAPPGKERLAMPQWILAAACVAIGLAPVFVLSVAARAARIVLSEAPGTTDAMAPTASAVWLSALAMGLWAGVILMWVVRSVAARSRRFSPTWSCAFADTTSRMQYTASSYASPLLANFGPISGVREVRSTGAFRTHAIEPVLDLIGRPLWRRLEIAGARLRPLQAGGLRWYLLYTILCLLGLLLYLRLWSPS